jgi:reverse gyrase
MVRTMLDEYKTLDQFWAEAINTACYSINRIYLHRILKKTSYELLTGKSPMFHILESLVANVLFLLKEVENLNLFLRL